MLAGGRRPRRPRRTADGAAMWRLHVEAATQLVERFAPTLSAGGRIVLIGSRTANGSPGCAQYAATEAALVGMAAVGRRSSRPATSPSTSSPPGATETPLLRDTLARPWLRACRRSAAR